MSFQARLRPLLRSALGHEPCDTVLYNARILDVFSCTFKEGALAIRNGVIVGLEDPGESRSVRRIDLRGKAIVPGFLDAHVHIESSLLTPSAFERAVLPKGTTGVIADPHEIANVLGTPGIEYFLNAAKGMHLDLRVMLSSCVPATHLETNGGGEIDATALRALQHHPHALGLAEVMNVPAVLNGEEGMLAKLAAFQGKPVDGHCPLLRGQALSAYAAAGITSCHESSERDEAEEKLRKGIAVWIREGSVAKDLRTLAPLLTLATSTSMGFCTDDRNPLDIAEEGHLDHLIRGAIAQGVSPEVAYRTASWSVARHYGLADHGSNGRDRVGALAPGFAADFVVLDDIATCQIAQTWKRGVPVDELAFSSEQPRFENTIRITVPEETDLEDVPGLVNVIGIQPGKLITEHLVLPSDHAEVMTMHVLERYGGKRAPALGYAKGFGPLQGAIASSVGHDSHNLIVVGRTARDRRAALVALARMGGGFVVVRDGNVLAELALPFGGLMTTAEDVAVRLRALREASQAIGCTLHEPFLQLAFLSLPVIPSLKLTDRGLVDVNRFEIISVRAA
jgi:adenine deaminase